MALVGGSGEGKSLLLQSVLGLLPDVNMRCHGEIILMAMLCALRTKIEHAVKRCYVPQGSSALKPIN